MINWILQLFRQRPEPLPLSHPSFAPVHAGFQLYVKCITENPGWNDQEVVAELQKCGVDNDLAQELVYFVPSAFGRPFLRSLGVTLNDHCLLMSSTSNAYQKVMLDEVKSFVVASSNVEEYRTAEHGELYTLIAGRSAEVHAISAAAQGGEVARNAAGSHFGPLVVTMQKAAGAKA